MQGCRLLARGAIEVAAGLKLRSLRAHEAAERPPQPDDPRPARNVPPFGGAA
jgi:hypothetical protein